MKTSPAILPKNLKILKELGENIKLARLRRKISSEQMAERTGTSRKTIYNIEQGSPSVSIGSYLQVLFVVGLEKDLLKVAGVEKTLKLTPFRRSKLTPLRRSKLTPLELC